MWLQKFSEIMQIGWIRWKNSLLLFCCPFAVQAEDVELIPQEEIAEAPALEPMTEEQLNDLLGEEMYLGTLDLRGNKVDTKRDYSKKKNK